MLRSILVVCAGASIGAVCRWLLGNGLNRRFPKVPPGTLAANLIGAYLIGLAIAAFAAYPGIATEWRLFIVVGLLGGLTTFSTFSAELAFLVEERRFAWAVGAVTLHVAGSLAMTFLGVATFSWLV